MSKTRGGAYVKDQHVKTELASIDRELKGLRRKIVALEKRRDELVGGGGKTPAARVK